METVTRKVKIVGLDEITEIRFDSDRCVRVLQESRITEGNDMVCLGRDTALALVEAITDWLASTEAK